MTTPAHQRAREIVDTHFPNYARQTVPVSITELENAIAAALEEEIEACAKVCDELFKSERNKSPDDRIGDGSADTAYHLAAALRQRGKP